MGLVARAVRGAASFVGSFTGAAIGLIAILIGALVNAHLNRRRDDRLRDHERRATAAALKAELSAIRRALISNADKLSKPDGADFLAPDLGQSIYVLPHMIPKLGLFDQNTVEVMIEAYGVIKQYGDNLVILGGKLKDTPSKKIFYMQRGRAEAVAKMNRNIAKQIGDVIEALDAYL